MSSTSSNLFPGVQKDVRADDNPMRQSTVSAASSNIFLDPKSDHPTLRSSTSATSTNVLLDHKNDTDVQENPTLQRLLSTEAEDFPQEKPRLSSRWKRQRFLIILAILSSLIIIFLAIFLPLFFIKIRPNHGNPQAALGGGKSSSGSTTSSAFQASSTAASFGAISGGDGSIITLDNGTTFTYKNQFGGFWVQDPNDPFNDNAQPNSWTPPLNASWKWGVDHIYGVNLGGLFSLEPFITPDIFQRYPTAVDEYTLSVAMAADTANGGLSQLENHYNTFITEPDIAEIASAGLNYLRIPISFWAIETISGEPFLESTSWKYVLRILNWARKYGLRVCLDLHAVPGSQNGYNHSGRFGVLNFLSGNMGLANAERTLYYIRVLTEFISQPQYRNLITVFGIINEPLLTLIGADQMTSFYLQAHDMIRSITGFGEGNGPYIAIHDSFQPPAQWAGFLAGSDRVILDSHFYFSFGGPQPNPLGVLGTNGLPGGTWPLDACTSWAPWTNQSRSGFGVAYTGEFSASPNDCGLYVNGVGGSASSPNCPEYDNWQEYNTTMKQGISNFLTASYDAFEDWFFWTWKIGADNTGTIGSPLWSYQLGFRNGWIPTDPRVAQGTCGSLGVASEPFVGTYLPWQTGTTSSIAAASSSQFPWPPTQIASAGVSMSLLPTYTATGPITTLPVATFTGVPSQITQSVNGWFNAADKAGGIITVAGCSYPNEYDGIFKVTPTAPCTGPAATPA